MENNVATKDEVQFWACLICSNVSFSGGKAGLGIAWLCLALAIRIFSFWKK